MCVTFSRKFPIKFFLAAVKHQQWNLIFFLKSFFRKFKPNMMMNKENFQKFWQKLYEYYYTHTEWWWWNEFDTIDTIDFTIDFFLIFISRNEKRKRKFFFRKKKLFHRPSIHPDWLTEWMEWKLFIKKIFFFSFCLPKNSWNEWSFFIHSFISPIDSIRESINLFFAIFHQ